MTEQATAREAQFERMFMAACEALGAINEALGLDPDDGGAEPILEAIEELKAKAALQSAEQDRKDAERYRWLRKRFTPKDSGNAIDPPNWRIELGDELMGETLDDAIRTAMQTKERG